MIIGIDASLTATGWCVLDGEHVDTGRIRSKLKGVERLLEIEGELLKMLTAFNPALVCIEGYSFGSKGMAVYQIGELGGIIRRLLHVHSIPWIEIAPVSVKKFATGKGNTKKEQVIAHVLSRWGVHFDTSDEADAFVLAKIGEALLKGCEGLTKAQEEALIKPREAWEGGK